MEVPLIVTIRMDDTSFSFFNSLRKIYFPSELNYIDAHLTLFHALPTEEYIMEDLIEASTRFSPFPIHANEPAFLGNGVAYKLDSEKVMDLHLSLQKKWMDVLIPQDRQKLWPHITVQNKVEKAEAEALMEFLKSYFSSFDLQALGLDIWEYRQGPWAHKAYFPFSQKD